MVVDAEHIVHHQNLSVAIRAGADADDRRLQFPRQAPPQRLRHILGQHHVGAVRDAFVRLAHQRVGLRRLFTLAPQAAEFVHRLRAQPDMRAHRNALPAERGDDGRRAVGDFQFDHLRAAVLHQALGAVERLQRRQATHERQVGGQHRARQPAPGAAAVVGDVVGGHGDGRAPPLHHRPQRVADQHQVHAGALHRARERGVVGGQAGDGFAGLFHVAENAQRAPRAGVGRIGHYRDIICRSARRRVSGEHIGRRVAAVSVAVRGGPRHAAALPLFPPRCTTARIRRAHRAAGCSSFCRRAPTGCVVSVAARPIRSRRNQCRRC